MSRIDNIPRIHALQRKTAEEIFYLVYKSTDKNFKKGKIEAIEHWLAEMGFLGNEYPTELAKDWQEYCGPLD